jgi:hypothetical protein
MPKVNRAPSWPYASRFAWFWLGQMWVLLGPLFTPTGI